MAPKKNKDSSSKEPQIPGFVKVPGHMTEWEELIKEGDLASKTIYDLKYLGSGSRTTERQFLLSRVLITPLEPLTVLELIKPTFGLDQTWAEAQAIISESHTFKYYIWLVQNNVDVFTLDMPSYLRLGAFGAVLVQQEEIKSSPQQKFAEDETVPTTALTTFLQQLSLLVPKSGQVVNWTPSRIEFSVEFKDGNKSKQYTTITDGALRNKPKAATVPQRVLAIVEVKKRERAIEQKRIQMQEAAEFVGWIKNHRQLNVLDLSGQLVSLCFVYVD
jgi:hypothetical protein